MTGIVNDYFKQFYPSPLEHEKFEYSSMLGGMERYTGNANNIFPRIKCADGFSMSVQGHFGSYSDPRDDFANYYSQVEVGYPSERVEELMPYIDGADSKPTDTVYGYVPIEIVEKIILGHGGIKK